MQARSGSLSRRRILVADSDPASRRKAVAAVAALGSAEAVEADGLQAGLARGATGSAAAIADIASERDLDLFERMARSIEGPVIATSATGSLGLAVEAMRRGAADFVPKPFAPDALAARLEKLLRAPAPSRPPQPMEAVSEPFIGGSAAMREVQAKVARIACSKAPVFITGESGTGKEVCAEAIHARSGRRPLVALNCAAIPKDLMESEIFGHARGAFTGATEHRPGAAELAHRGTLFLDEVCEMELGLQSKLLRFLQTGEIRRVGEPEAKLVDVRIVCATNRDPAREVAAGRFREDLFYRLHVLPIHLPPLREREGDALELARAFLARYAREEGRIFAGFDEAAERRLAAHPWPGNVRELQNVVRRAVVLHDGDRVTQDMLPPEIGQSQADARDRISARGGMLESEAASRSIVPFRTQEQQIIETALAAFDGNAARAAALEISPSTIYRKRQAWGLSPA